MRLHIIRHADPEYTHDDLTALGHTQAQALSQHMEKLPLYRIVCSPKGRAQATARPTSERTGIPIETLDWLRELDGLKSEHDSPILPNPVVTWDLPGHVLRQVKAGEGEIGDTLPAFPQPETADRFAELRAGCTDFLRQLHIEMSPDGWTTDRRLLGYDIAIFCHHGVGLALLSVITNIPIASIWRSFWLAPASVTTILLEQTDMQHINPRIICLSDTHHLPFSAQCGNTSGLLYNLR